MTKHNSKTNRIDLVMICQEILMLSHPYVSRYYICTQVLGSRENRLYFI